MQLKVLALGGDGIGPEVVNAALQVLDVAARRLSLHVDLTEDLLGGAAWDKLGMFISPDTLVRAKKSHGILVGAVGGPKWDHITVDGGPEEQDGLMKLRHELQVFACLRHAKTRSALLNHTAFRPEILSGTDIMLMRELCGGAMFTNMRGIAELDRGERRAYDLNEYTSTEIERFARVGFEVARRRQRQVVSVDKSNVFVAGGLWRDVVNEVRNKEFPDVELTHFFADNAAYQLCCRPAEFDVILADNLFGDMLSDQVGAFAGSLGMLPSACVSELPEHGCLETPAIYEPVHGSAPDIVGEGIANPIGTILSVGMMLEYSGGRPDGAKRIDMAVEAALSAGIMTPDLGGTNTTKEVADAIIRHFNMQ